MAQLSARLRSRALWRMLLALLAYVLLTSAMAATGNPASATSMAPGTLRFDQFNVEQGLPQESVLAIVQDAQGFMWFGSQAGLTRYDGYRTTVYKSAVGTTGSLADNWVRVLHLGHDGALWAGTDGGLDRFDPASQTFRHFAPQEPAKRGNGNRHIRAVIGDGGSGLWIGTADGLQHLDPATGRFTIWHHDDNDPASLGHDSINALARDAAGRLWVGTASGLGMLAPGAKGFVHYRLDRAANATQAGVKALMVASDRALWIGTQAGAERWTWGGDAAAGSAGAGSAGAGSAGAGSAGAGSAGAGSAPERTRYGRAEGLSGGEINTLYQDPEGTIWLGSHDDGLYQWQPARGRFLQHRHLPSDAHSVADNRISALYRDRVGTFWVGTWYRGVSRVDLASGGFARHVRIASQPDAPIDNKVRAVVEAGDGGLWLGTNGGLSRYDPASGVAEVMEHDPANPDSLRDDRVGALLRDRDGMLWVGTNIGLDRYDPVSRRFTHLAFGPGDNAGSDEIRGLAQERSGAIWVGTRGGLHRLDPQRLTFDSFHHDPADSASLADNVVRPVLEDRGGALWVGTFNGLDLLDRASGRFTHYRHDPSEPSSLSHDEVHYLYQDRAGTLWVGTASGLNRMRRGPDGSVSFQRYTRKDGLADDAISSILGDSHGHIWFSTNSGITRLDPATGAVHNYSGADGAIEGAYFDNSALASDGTLYFGGFNGMTSFEPAAIRENDIAPPVVITDLQVFNKSLHPGRGDYGNVLTRAIELTPALTLEARATVFSFEFAALHYAAPQRNRYAYQLQGFDQGWVQTDASKRFATYTNLDPGRYVFRVTAANKDGVWNPHGATLTITILPPYWKTWWFRTLVAMLVLAAALAVYRGRVAALQRQQRRLEQQVGLRTAEVEHKNELLRHQAGELDARRREAEGQRAEAEQRRIEAERQKQEVELQKDKVELAHRNISVLSEIGRELTATLDIETAMNTVYRHVHQLMDANMFGIGFYREEKGLIEFPFSIEHGVRSAPYTRSLADRNQFAVWCLLNERAVFINDLEAEHSAYIDSAGLATVTVDLLLDGSAPDQPQSMMYTPLRVNERVVGVLVVQSVVKNAYRQVHLDMLQTLAAHAAVGLDNARAYQQLETALQRLRDTQARLLEQEKQVRLHTDELALANRSLQENDERLRLAKQKAEDATRQKSEFLANMSHEMRTPLAGVIGMLGFALRDRQLQSVTREQIERGQTNARSLLTIINDLLDFSKIEAGKFSIEHIDFGLAEAVGSVVSLFEEEAAVRGVEFAVVYGPDLPAFVEGDPTRLRQLLVNLLGNAFKFTQAGTVTLHVEREPEPEQAPGINRIRFVVRDTGIGIAPEAMARLFQKFEQADTTTTRRYGGTGLGLAICRQLVELMDGHISVASTLGEGSTFTFVLPLADGGAPPAPEALTRAPHSHRLHVLCAEDFPTNQIIIRMLLEELGHRVDIAANGALAVAACASERYDLVLMDGRMPEMDGASATRLIRAGGPATAPVLDRDVMIVALTANASDEDRERYLGAGMDDFLTKPIDEAALHVQLERAIVRQLARGVALPLLDRPLAATPDATGADTASGASASGGSASGGSASGGSASGGSASGGSASGGSAASPGSPGLAALDAMFGVAAALPETAAPAPAPAPAGQRPNQLRTRIRAAFAADVPGRLAELDAALARHDSDTAGRLLHGLKGSAAYLEEPELQQLCGELERDADSGHWPPVLAALPRLRQLLMSVATE
jgi:signal transduction histidine kinase/ligand-binding sensor domain-containing protein/CheY-like chemotaxis protein/HPt (histidine-containing phosphotransfer) domain-containing protein